MRNRTSIYEWEWEREIATTAHSYIHCAFNHYEMRSLIVRNEIQFIHQTIWSKNVKSILSRTLNRIAICCIMYLTFPTPIQFNRLSSSYKISPLKLLRWLALFSIAPDYISFAFFRDLISYLAGKLSADDITWRFGCEWMEKKIADFLVSLLHDGKLFRNFIKYLREWGREQSFIEENHQERDSVF